MISAILNGNPWLIPAFLVTSAVICSAALYLAQRHSWPKWLAVLLGLAIAGELTATLYPSYIGAGAPGVCTVDKNLLAPLATQQGVLNIAMFVPLGLVGTLLLRRPAACLAGGIVLSAATELIQAITPHIGRSCTSEDFVANSIGAATGVVCGVLGSRLGSRKFGAIPIAKSDLIHGGKLAGFGIAAIAIIGWLNVTTIFADPALTTAGGAEKQAAERVVRQILDDDTEITKIQEVKGNGKNPDQIIATLKDGFLSFTDDLSYITGSMNTASFSGIPARPLKSDQDAVNQATTFVQKQFPWALKGSKISVQPASQGSKQRIVAWRAHVDNVLMPMRMDVIIEQDGRISSFTGSNDPAPSVPPSHKITAQEAQLAAKAHIGGGQFKNAQLLMQKNEEGKWETRWSVTFLKAASGADPQNSPGVTVLVNAETGKVVGIAS